MITGNKTFLKKVETIFGSISNIHIKKLEKIAMKKNIAKVNWQVGDIARPLFLIREASSFGDSTEPHCL